MDTTYTQSVLNSTGHNAIVNRRETDNGPMFMLSLEYMGMTLEDKWSFPVAVTESELVAIINAAELALHGNREGHQSA